jgi:hypothetical protein
MLIKGNAKLVIKCCLAIISLIINQVCLRQYKCVSSKIIVPMSVEPVEADEAGPKCHHAGNNMTAYEGESERSTRGVSITGFIDYDNMGNQLMTPGTVSDISGLSVEDVRRVHSSRIQEMERDTKEVKEQLKRSN